MGKSRIPDLSSVASPPRRNLKYSDIKIEEVIGSGGQAVVSKAYVSNDNRKQSLAVKEPTRDSKTLPVKTVDRFLEEAQTWATVDAREREKPRWRDSEHIVGVVDFGDRLPWIALEYMDGGGLDDRLRESPTGLSLGEALWIGECVCRGVEVAHNCGIAHLDLKPANVLFRETPDHAWDVPKVADWGIARILAEQTGTMEALSVEYAAPEQFDAGEFGEPDMLTDVYQVGALMYAILNGKPPFTGSQTKVLHDVVYGDPPEPPSTHRSEIPPALDAAVMIALEVKKADRYQAVKTIRETFSAIRTDGHLPPIVTKRLEGHTQTSTSVNQWPGENMGMKSGTSPDGDVNSRAQQEERPTFDGSGSTTVAGGADLTPTRALSGTNVFVRYASKHQPTLRSAHDGQASPEEVTSNLLLEHQTQVDEEEVIDGNSYKTFLSESMEYLFVEWLIHTLLFKIRDTGHEDGLRDLYDTIPEIDRVELHTSVSLAEDDSNGVPNQVLFDVVAFDKYGNPLLVANLHESSDPVTREMLEELEESASALKSRHPDLGAAFMITSSFFDPGAFEVADQATSGGSFFSRGPQLSYVSLEPQPGYLPIRNLKQLGYHLCLVESRSGGFNMTVPEL